MMVKINPAGIFWKAPPESAAFAESRGTIWHWDGQKGWYLRAPDYQEGGESSFTPRSLDRSGFIRVPNPRGWPEELRVPEGL